MTEIPGDQHITYQLQYRKCGKASCSTCRNSQGHGPYWYAYWREGSRLRSGYIGKVHPHLHGQPTPGGGELEHKEPDQATHTDQQAVGGTVLESLTAAPALPGR
ncbi:MAG TPA: hypothetical protein VGT82_01710 [Ktedonobacteraceae bacterium]|nr:hypothetical protein [Ktedonobacteraceae bacterium]